MIMISQDEIAQIVDESDLSWIKVEQYKSGPVNTTGDLECEFDVFTQHHKDETTFLINKCRELAKALSYFQSIQYLQ